MDRKYIEDIVIPLLNRRKPDTIGTVLRYDAEANVADVDVVDQASGGTTVLRDVPYGQSTVGIKAVAPRVGSRVWISFRGGNPSAPVITGDLNYTKQDMELKYGAPMPAIFNYL